jgi:FKBP-type peptidyl-prolyl cis-trans isomerase
MTPRSALPGLALLLLATTSCRLWAPKPPVYEVRSLESGVQTQNVVIPLDESRPRAALGDRLVLHFSASLEDGTVVDSSLDQGVPIECVLGDGSLPAGLEQGIVGMRPGGERRIVVPPDLAFGEQGIHGLVPPSATILFLVELIGLERDPR